MTAGKWLTAAAFGLIAIAVLTFRPVQTPGPFLRDFEAYWSAGAAWNTHADPYGRAVWNAERRVPGVDGSRDELLPFAGPPATLLAWSALARLPYVVAARMWFVLLLLAALALALLAVGASGRRVFWTPSLAAVAMALAFGPLTSDLALGQIALLAFLGACVAVVFGARATRSPLAQAVATFVALLQPNVAVGLVSQLGRVRTALAIALGAAAAYAAGAYVAGWSWALDYARRIVAHESAERFSAIQLTPAAIAYGTGASS
ncbi:MAG TPA: glycosyltransferase 87 family protein, partial [Candidatus Tumulicola sp.]